MGKQVKYNPDSSIWGGHVVIDVPDYGTRKSIKAEFKKMGGDHIKIIDRAHELAIKHTIGCELTHIETGMVFTNFEDILEYNEGEDVLTEIGLCITKGPKLGKILSAQ